MRPGRAADHSPPSSHGRVELYLYPPSGPHRACNGITLPFVANIYCHIHRFVGLWNDTCRIQNNKFHVLQPLCYFYHFRQPAFYQLLLFTANRCTSLLNLFPKIISNLLTLNRYNTLPNVFINMTHYLKVTCKF